MVSMLVYVQDLTLYVENLFNFKKDKMFHLLEHLVNLLIFHFFNIISLFRIIPINGYLKIK